MFVPSTEDKANTIKVWGTCSFTQLEWEASKVPKSLGLMIEQVVTLHHLDLGGSNKLIKGRRTSVGGSSNSLNCLHVAIRGLQFILALLCLPLKVEWLIELSITLKPQQ